MKATARVQQNDLLTALLATLALVALARASPIRRRPQPASAGPIASEAPASSSQQQQTARPHSRAGESGEHAGRGARRQGRTGAGSGRRRISASSTTACEQKIEGFDMGGAPLSVAIVVETSSRIEALLPAMRRTGILFTQTVLGENGDAAVIGYNDEVNTLLDFTSDHDAIEKAVTNLQAGDIGSAALRRAFAGRDPAARAGRTSRRRVIITLAEAAGQRKRGQAGRSAARRAARQHHHLFGRTLFHGRRSCAGRRSNGGPPSATPPGTFGVPPHPGTLQTPTTEAAAQRQRGHPGALAAWVVQHAEPSGAGTSAGNGRRGHRRPLPIHGARRLDRTGHRPDRRRAARPVHAELPAHQRPSSGGYHEIKCRWWMPGAEGALAAGLLRRRPRRVSTQSRHTGAHSDPA